MTHIFEHPEPAVAISPTTPSRAPTVEIEALERFVNALSGDGDGMIDTSMDLEEAEDDEDLDADIEDMDEELENSFVEGDSMEL